MSYNNNYSYFNGSGNDWWGARDAKRPTNFDENRILKIDYNNQPYAQNYMQNYAQSMILPSENRPVEQIHPRHEVLQGTVTQLFSAFGYINDNIIFSKSDVSGPMVKVGDRVAVDATYQPNNPTKYKGERVCKIDDSRFSTPNTLSKMKPLSRDLASRIDMPLPYDSEPSPMLSKESKRLDMRLDRKNDRRSDSHHRLSVSKETREDELRKYEILFSRANSPIAAIRPNIIRKSLKDSPRNPLKRKARSSSKNQKHILKSSGEADNRALSKVSVDKTVKQIESFSLRELDCASLKSRCRNLLPPSQFFHVSLKYQQTFPLNHPMKLGNACHFKVMDKKVKSIDNYINDQLNRDIDPEDADTTFSAKVMLLSTDDLAEFYKKTLPLAEEFDSANKIPITKAIKFLVGSLGPNEEFAFGGAWSPSLDGADPDTNPRVLINTAIRTCKNLTGIDLSGCSSWPKFLELHYYRPLQKTQRKSMGQDGKTDCRTEAETEERFDYIEPRMETVVYYVPDIWNCAPSQESWNEIRRMYQEQLTSLMCPPPSIPFSNKSISATSSLSKNGSPNTKKSPSDNQEEEDYIFNENEEVDEKSNDSEMSLANKQQCSHYSTLNVDGMKIAEIKKELELRNLSIKGVMDQLKARLKSSLEKEEMEEKLKDSQIVAKPLTEPKSPCETILTETEKSELKLLYSLPDCPQVIVHHNQKYQDNKMKIKIMSLHSLLSYYDLKLDESTFEVALFAKQFLEMLRRDAVFNIYKSLVVTPETDLIPKEENEAKKPKIMVTISKRTVNRPLLFSCLILDREKTNKIPSEDLKCMIEGLGICLSSEQLTTLLSKIKDSSKGLHYRLLTDKEVDDNNITKILHADQTDDLDYIRELAMGNKALFEEEAPIDISVDYEEINRLKNELDKSERCRQTMELRFAENQEESERAKSIILSQKQDIEKMKEQISEYRTKYHQAQDRGDYYKKDLDKMLKSVKEIDRMATGLTKYVTGTVDRFKKADKSQKSETPSLSTSSSAAATGGANGGTATSSANSKSKSIESIKVKGVGGKNEKSFLNNEVKAKLSISDQKSESSDRSNDESIISNSLENNSSNINCPNDEDVSSTPMDADMSETATQSEEICSDKNRQNDGDNEDGDYENIDKKSDDENADDHKISTEINHGPEDFELSKPSDYEIIILDEAE